MADNFNSILRNRIERTAESGEAPEFEYPDITDDPIARYRQRFGVKGDEDPFLFPWAVNLVFEDRWILAEKDPLIALRNQFQRRIKIDIRDPDPDTANFPNGAYTLPKGRLYIENSPVGFYGPSRNGTQPRTYQWEFLIRYGLTDNLEFRIFSNGLTHESAQPGSPAVTGFSPVAFDFKVNFWEENTKYHIPAVGVEMYIQTDLGSPAFNSGTQPSLNLLFDQSLPLDLSFEYNLGISGVQNNTGQIAYQFSFQWSLQHEIVKDFDLFWHGFYNAAALPRLLQFQNVANAGIPQVTASGVGGIWTVNNRLAIFGSLNFGLTPAAPDFFALGGFAVAF
ncbi:MAG: transporter [Planctomycetes bacterium]|nr:transporter [Planctomycetota bacterium]